MPTRRSTLLGLGTLLFGSSAIASGAFEAAASVNSDFRVVVVADLTLEPGRDGARYVETDENDHVTAINLDGTDAGASGVNERARTRFEDLVILTNNGALSVKELYFEFEVDVEAQHDEALEGAIEKTLHIVSAENKIDATGDVDFLTISESEDVEDGELGPGDSVPFGIQIDLLSGHDSDGLTSLPESGFDVTLTIRAEME